MDLDTACLEPLLDDWLEALQYAVKEQEGLVQSEDEFYMPLIAVPAPVVNAVFKITDHLDLGPDAKYIAIHLYDKFMCNYFWDVYKDADQTDGSWSQVCKKLSRYSKLHLMSCLQLASKMDSHSRNIRISQVISMLQSIDDRSEYTPSMIFSSEYFVFQTVGFKMPFYTPIHCIEMLLAGTGLKNTPNMQELTTNLLDLVYLQKEKLYDHLHCLIRGNAARTYQEKRNLMTLVSNVLFLGASVVLCGTFFSSIDSETATAIAYKLSELIDIRFNDIWDTANVLLIMAIQE